MLAVREALAAVREALAAVREALAAVRELYRGAWIPVVAGNALQTMQQYVRDAEELRERKKRRR